MDINNIKGETTSFFTVDLGATSGRTILCKLGKNGEINTEELTRFENRILQTGGHCYWDIFAIYQEIIRGLKIIAKREEPIVSIGIDSWGVDFVFIGKDNAILRNPLSYRDPHTFAAMDDFFENVMDRKTLYQKTGIQVMNFNSIFQLHAMRKEGNVAYANADKILFLPDALSWMLTGEMVCEYTIASTSQLLNPYTKELDEDLLAAVGANRGQFGRIVMPGEQVGTLTEEVQKLTGLGAVPVIAVAGHDTGSAVAAVPASNEHFAYLSSGTWSLMGIENKEPVVSDFSYDNNFTNEGGVDGTVRFLKNICGMWLLECCRREWSDDVPKDHQELIKAAQQVEPFRSMINPDDPSFANPPSMINAIREYCEKTGQAVPETYGEICRCIFDSLALRYKQVMEYLRSNSDHAIKTLHIIGGGSRNQYLNQITANACGINVLAGPQECTALGNFMVQARAAGKVSDLQGMRAILANNVTMTAYYPADTEIWNTAYEKFTTITNNL